MTIDVVEHKGDAFKVRSTEELYQARDGGWVDLPAYMEVSQVIGVPLVIICYHPFIDGIIVLL